MDEKRLRGEEEHTISQAEIDAWKRGDKDAAKNAILKSQTRLSVEKAVALVKMYAKMGDIHYIVTRFDVRIDEARRILASFNINSIEDARRVVATGVIAEYEQAVAEGDAEKRAQNQVDHHVAQERLDEQQRKLEKAPIDVEEKDELLRQRALEAQQKNKQDQLRQLIAEGIDPKTKTSNFRVPLGLVGEFKKLIPNGVSQLQRRFGGTRKDIVNEIRRLAPDVDIDVLRP